MALVFKLTFLCLLIVAISCSTTTESNRRAAEIVDDKNEVTPKNAEEFDDVLEEDEEKTVMSVAQNAVHQATHGLNNVVHGVNSAVHGINSQIHNTFSGINHQVHHFNDHVSNENHNIHADHHNHDNHDHDLNVHHHQNDHIDHNGNIFNPFGGLMNILQGPPRPPVTKTRVLTLHVTKTLTRHPVCMLATKKIPTCSHSTEEHHPHKLSHYHEYPKDDSAAEVQEVKGDELDVWEELEATSKSDVATPSLDVDTSRSGKYLKFGEDSSNSDKSVINEGEIEEEAEDEEISAIDKLRHLRRRSTKYVTKTLYVTSVQRILDDRVTATLVPQNCVPSGNRIRICHH